MQLQESLIGQESSQGDLLARAITSQDETHKLAAEVAGCLEQVAAANVAQLKAQKMLAEKEQSHQQEVEELQEQLAFQQQAAKELQASMQMRLDEELHLLIRANEALKQGDTGKVVASLEAALQAEVNAKVNAQAAVEELRSEQAQHRQELAEASADLKAAREAVTDAEQLLTEAFRHRATMEAKMADMEQQLAETEHQEKADLQQLLDASNHQHNSLEKQVTELRERLHSARMGKAAPDDQGGAERPQSETTLQLAATVVQALRIASTAAEVQEQTIHHLEKAGARQKQPAGRPRSQQGRSHYSQDNPAATMAVAIQAQQKAAELSQQLSTETKARQRAEAAVTAAEQKLERIRSSSSGDHAATLEAPADSTDQGGDEGMMDAEGPAKLPEDHKKVEELQQALGAAQREQRALIERISTLETAAAEQDTQLAAADRTAHKRLSESQKQAAAARSLSRTTSAQDTLRTKLSQLEGELSAAKMAQKSQAAQSKNVQRRMSKNMEQASSNAARASAALQKEEANRGRLQQWVTEGSRLQLDMFSALQGFLQQFVAQKQPDFGSDQDDSTAIKQARQLLEMLQSSQTVQPIEEVMAPKEFTGLHEGASPRIAAFRP
ncbi:hypothetical protein WJX84_001976 [Apatococcus fuscideae]|uniref:Uncharacterized protein n=1 Tax=Apatococcus fuscideae TaxID=2026836 RepID=A0AAW1SNP2_9CHLO